MKKIIPRMRINWRTSISTKFSLTCVGLIIFAALIVGICLIFVAFNSEQDHIYEFQKKNADTVALLITGYVQNIRDKILVFEQSNYQALFSSELSKNRLLDLLIQNRQSFSSFTIVDLNGTESLKVSLFHTYLPDELKNISNTASFSQAAEGNLYVSPVYIDPDSGLLSVLISIPIRDKRDNIIGVFIAEGNCIRLWREIYKQNVNTKGYSYIVDNKGHFIAFQDASEILNRYGEDMSSLPPVSDFISGIPENQTQVQHYPGLFGEEVIGTYAPVYGTDWAVITELPSKDAYASVDEMIRYLVVLLISGICIAAGTGYLLSIHLVDPIHELTITAKRLGNRDWDLDITEINRNDEVGVLARTFLQMKNELKKTYEDLEKRLIELAETQNKLKLSEEQYRTIFENCGNPLMLIEEDMTVALMNHMFEDLSGYSKHDIEGKEKWTCFVADPDDLKRMKSYHKNRRISSDPSIPMSYEFKFLTRDKLIKDVIVTVVMMPGLSRSIAALIDITRLKEAQNEVILKNEDLHAAYEELAANEEELRNNFIDLHRKDELLRESEQKYRSVVEDQTELICRYTGDGTIIFVNDAFCHFLGVIRDDIIGTRFSPQYYDKDGEDVIATIRSITPDQPTKTSEHRIILNREEIRWIHVIYRGFFNSDKKITYYQSVAHDITERKNAEYALQQARKKLNLLNAVTFSDIQNYIFTLSGYLELHRDLIEDEGQRSFIEKEQETVSKINHSLLFAKDYQDMGMKSAGWQNVLQSFLYAISHLDLSNITRIINLENLEIYADPLLEKVFFNLSSNVLIHGDHVTKLMVSYQEIPQGLVIIFEDDGVGIPGPMKNIIFDRRSGDKKGIGLFFVREILGITGITISEDGEEGKGARFIITIPKGRFRFHDPGN